LSSEKKTETDIKITKLSWSQLGNIVMVIAKDVSEKFDPDVVVVLVGVV